MNRSRLLTAVAAALSLLLALSACSSGSPTQQPPTTSTAPTAPKSDGKLIYAQHMPIRSLDSVNYQTYPASYEAGFTIYNNLVTWDKDFKIVGDLAESWVVSPDQRTWTFKLHQNVTFHDGSPFNASAVKAHITRIQDPATGSPNKNLWDHITSIDTPDDYTVALTTKEPFGAMLNYLAHGSGGISSPTAIEKWGKDYNVNPVGTGPYKVQSFTPGGDLVLVRNESYFKETPKLGQITLKYVPEAGARIAMLQTGEADVISDIPPEEAKRLETVSDVQLIRRPGLRTFFLEMNLSLPQFQDVRVRQALNHAIDKESIVRNLFLGYATVLTSPAASTIQGHAASPVYSYDPEKAKQLLLEAGYTLDNGVMVKDGQPLKFSINTAEGEYPKDIQVVETIQNQFKAIGVQTEIWKVEAAARWSYLRIPLSEAKYEALIFGFNPSNGDIGYHLSALFKSNPDRTKAPYVWNSMWYENKLVDALLDKGAFATDQAERATHYGEAQKLIYQDAPAVWLYTPELLIATRTNVEGVILWPTIFTVVREAGVR